MEARPHGQEGRRGDLRLDACAEVLQFDLGCIEESAKQLGWQFLRALRQHMG